MEKLKRYVISLLVSFIISIVLLCVTATIFTYTSINDNYLDSFVFGIVTISVLIGSLILCRRLKEKGLIYGVLFGMFYCLIILLLNILAKDTFAISNTVGIYFSICALSGIIGGIVGVNV